MPITLTCWRPYESIRSVVVPSRLSRQRGRQSIPIVIHTEAIELAAFLKWAHLAESGGQAKWVIQSRRVVVNGVVERHRSRRLVPGDRVVVGGRAYKVASEPAGVTRSAAGKR